MPIETYLEYEATCEVPDCEDYYEISVRKEKEPGKKISKDKLIEEIRQKGWFVSKNKKIVYCPEHRKGRKNG